MLLILETSGLLFRSRKITSGHLHKEMIVAKQYASTKHRHKLLSTQGVKIEDHTRHTSHE